MLQALQVSKLEEKATLLDHITSLDTFVQVWVVRLVLTSQVLSYGFTHGSAVERFIENDEFCKQVIQAAQTVDCIFLFCVC